MEHHICIQENYLTFDGDTIPFGKKDIEEQKKPLIKQNEEFSKDIKEGFKKLEKKKNFIDMYKSFDSDVFKNDIKSINNIWLEIFKEKNIEECYTPSDNKIDIFNNPKLPCGCYIIKK
mgnify:CR=1 FL=1